MVRILCVNIHMTLKVQYLKICQHFKIVYVWSSRIFFLINSKTEFQRSKTVKETTVNS